MYVLPSIKSLNSTFVIGKQKRIFPDRYPIVGINWLVTFGELNQVFPSKTSAEEFCSFLSWLNQDVQLLLQDFDLAPLTDDLNWDAAIGLRRLTYDGIAIYAQIED